MYERKDESGKIYSIPCLGVLTESGVLLNSGETLTEGKVVEFAREASELWTAKDYKGLVDLICERATVEIESQDDYMLLSGTVICEKGHTVRWALIDASDILDDMKEDTRDIDDLMDHPIDK